MEEDIKHIEYILDLYKNSETQKYELVANLFPKSLKAIENILNELDRLKKENEELKENYKVLENAYITDSIPKSVIQDKIEELIEELNKEECDMRYDKYDIQEILKELLNKGE